MAARRAAAPARRLQRRATDPARRARSCRPSTARRPRRSRESLAELHPDRSPGSLGRGRVVPRPARARTGCRSARRRFSAEIPGPRQASSSQNMIAEAAGRSPRTIVVMAHRDNDGSGPGANDNASGTAMLDPARARLRAYRPACRPASCARTTRSSSSRPTAARSAALGAGGSPRTRPLGDDVVAVIDLDSVGGKGRIRLELERRHAARRHPEHSSQTAASRIAAQTGRPPGRAERSAPADRPRLPVLASTSRRRSSRRASPPSH